MLLALKNFLFAFKKPQNTSQLLITEEDSSKRDRKTHGLCVSSLQSPQHSIRGILPITTFLYHSKIKHKTKEQITGSGKMCAMAVTCSCNAHTFGNFCNTWHNSSGLKTSKGSVSLHFLITQDHLVDSELCFYQTLKKHLLGTSLAVLWLSIYLSKQGTWVQSLVRELRSHMPWGN